VQNLLHTKTPLDESISSSSILVLVGWSKTPYLKKASNVIYFLDLRE